MVCSGFRDPKRIEPMLAKVKEAWELYPDMRLGQLLAICAECANLLGVEDDEMLAGVQRYIDRMRKATGVPAGVMVRAELSEK